jgi:SHS2 domain-containing protein
MQSILISSKSAQSVDGHVRHSAQWNVVLETEEQDWELLLVHWLEEVLYRAEVHRQWCVNCSVLLRSSEGKIEAQG